MAFSMTWGQRPSLAVCFAMSSQRWITEVLLEVLPELPGIPGELSQHANKIPAERPQNLHQTISETAESTWRDPAKCLGNKDELKTLKTIKDQTPPGLKCPCQRMLGTGKEMGTPIPSVPRRGAWGCIF